MAFANINPSQKRSKEKSVGTTFKKMSCSFRVCLSIRQSLELSINLNISKNVWHVPQKGFVAVEVGEAGSHSGVRRQWLSCNDWQVWFHPKL